MKIISFFGDSRFIKKNIFLIFLIFLLETCVTHNLKKEIIDIKSRDLSNRIESNRIFDESNQFGFDSTESRIEFLTIRFNSCGTLGGTNHMIIKLDNQRA